MRTYKAKFYWNWWSTGLVTSVAVGEKLFSVSNRFPAKIGKVLSIPPEATSASRPSRLSKHNDAVTPH